ncbi:MAG: hypothetical protein A3E37_02805 [Candidatus Andersenbacteria bacterium RIFCSPHIGHO2_12_FULL_46_9]|nr:MAG: hypothetical protein A3B76_01280 [Candidatus Andersenbacteria bacterium RIFCSPHIGHO2_02_FULL_46_16]OGY36529.1 MAG: hypothetical protein A3E37_02805 [Candidatus Andersenbacteria bacterium RIFCSPHIGHO2_12_FULL_46_9]OGY39496.1 MAG: hypothetical protein A3G57_04245 [Candidatus Andersenbacteria bacterium RIFCSPLOWO2_12_FULL_45_8]HBE90794.1 hypothetical protein [Candidatus Andersenbacteria bacterium]
MGLMYCAESVRSFLFGTKNGRSTMDMPRWAFYLLAISAGLVGGIGDALLNQWAKHGGKWWLIASGYLSWVVALTLFLLMLKKGPLAHCVILFLLSNCIFIIAVSNLVFHEDISAQKWAGIILAIVAIVIMESG